MDDPLFAVGSLEVGGPWVGLRGSRRGYQLVIGRGAVVTAAVDASVGDVLSVAVAYFEETLGQPPAELAGTQRDIADALRWVAGTTLEATSAAELATAIDAVDDGLAVDEVVSRLSATLRALGGEDGIAHLRSRLWELGAG